MQVPRVLVVARRFWPFTEDACLRLLHQCAAIQKAGAKVTVLTGRWHSSWPEFSLCREVPVYRLLPSPFNNWNENHFQKNAAQWILKRQDDFDCIYVDRADGMLNTLLTKLSKCKKPFLVRFSPSDSGFGLSSGQKINQLAMAESCRRCTKIVCPTSYSHRLLISQGISESQIVRISDVALDRVNRSDGLKSLASHALFETSSDFVIPGRSEIVVHLGVSELKPLRAVIQSVCDFLDKGVMLRMWVVGSGIPPSALYDLVKSRGWHREVLLFDGFDDLQELIRVADLAIASNPQETLQYSLQLLAQAGVAMMVSDNPDCRVWLPEANHFQLYSSNQSLDLKLQDWLTNRERWSSMANSLRQNLRRGKSSEDHAQQWLSLFRDSCNESTT
jgi:glycosyltransferase involved in cell wall biosynthesis